MLTLTLRCLSAVALTLAAPLSLPRTTSASTDTEIALSIDARVELAGVLQVLSDSPLATQVESLYRQDVLTYFERFAQHPAVLRFQLIQRAGFAFDAVPHVMLGLSAPPQLERVRAIPTWALERAGGEQQLDVFLEELRRFAEESQLDTFLRAHAGSFASALRLQRAPVQKAVERLTEYAGHAFPRGEVILGPLMHAGGFGVLDEHDPDAPRAFALLGPVGVKDGLPDFGSAERLTKLLWHEFGHTLVNPLDRAVSQRVERSAALFEPIAEHMRRGAYPTWSIVVDEHLVRAIQVRLTTAEQGAAAGERSLAEHEARGFAYLRPLVERLREYEAQRDHYPDLTAFHPRLLSVFDELLAVSEPPAR